MRTSSRDARRRTAGGATRRRVWAALFALATLLGGLVAATPSGTPAAGAFPDNSGQQATTPRPDTGKLTPALATEAAKATGQPTTAPGASNAQDNTPGGLERQTDGEIIVDVQTTDTSRGTINALTASGATVKAISTPPLTTVTVSVAPSNLNALARVPQVRSMQEALTPVTNATCAPIVSEGDVDHKADVARLLYGVDGTGVQVGVMSDSYDTNATAPTHAAQDVAHGELPGATNPCGRTTAVNVVNDTVTGTDEGRAMAQTVHSLAPGSPMSFATASISQTSMASNITALRTAGAKVIVDDVTYFSEPFYQDGPISVSVNAARAAGVAYFSSAANSNVVDNGHDVGSYEATAYRGTTCPTLPFTYLDCHDFDPSAAVSNTESMTVAKGGKFAIDLQWANPWGGVTTDYDVFILNSSGTVLAQSVQNNGTTQTPFEFLSWTNNTGAAANIRVVVARQSGTGVRFKMIYYRSPITNVQFNTSSGGDIIGPTIFGHNGAANTFSVAAVPYNNLSVPESYSSKGPVTLLFNPVPSTTALGAPQTLAKPDFAAVDCVRNSFFGFFDGTNYRFCGTSDAAPHAAAIAALLLQAQPSLTVAQVGTALSTTAIPVGTALPDTVGAGLLQADAAVGSVVPCDHFLSGAQGSMLMTGGKWCVSGATFSGSVSVAPGTRAIFVNSTVNGSLAAKSATGLIVCGTTVTGTLTSGYATGFVLVGDPGDDGCPGNQIGVDAAFNSNTGGLEVGGNTIGRTLTLQSNSGVGPFPEDSSIEVEANTITANLGCVSNSSVTNDGQPNVVSGGRFGQCGAPGF